MNNLQEYPHVIYGEFVTDDVTMHLSPIQWQITLGDLRADAEVLSTPDMPTSVVQQHIDHCVTEFINVVDNSEFMLESLQRHGVSQGLNPYNFDPVLQAFFDDNNVKISKHNPTAWNQRGFIWAGIHSEICLASSITNARLLYPFFHNFILHQCTFPMLDENRSFLHDYARQAWNNVTLLNTNHVTIKVIKYE
jgi:hypothetical protein